MQFTHLGNAGQKLVDVLFCLAPADHSNPGWSWWMSGRFCETWRALRITERVTAQEHEMRSQI